MAQLLVVGLMMIIAVAAVVISTVIGLFFGNIIMFESIGLAIAAGCLSSHFFGIHPALCILIGIGAFIAFMLIMKLKIGFWTIGGAMSILWGLLVAAFVYDGTGNDMVWTYTTLGLVTIFILSLHIKAKNKLAA